MLNKKLTKNSLTALAMMSAMAFSSTSSAALLSYSQNWEGVNPATDTVIGDGFIIGNINVGTGGAWFENFAAPNSPAIGQNGYSAFVTGEGGVDQGNNQLSVFSDYNSWSPFTAGGVTLQTYTYRNNGTIGLDDVGMTYRFAFDGKLNGATDAWAFVKVLKQSDNSYIELANNTFDSTTLAGGWGGGFVDLTIDAGMVGELVQFGFANEAFDWGPSGVFYDNLNFAEVSAVPVPAAVWLFGSGLLGLVGVARRKKS